MQSQNLIRFKQSNQSKIDNVSLNALLSKIPESCIWCVTASCLDSIILKIFKSFLFLNFQTWNFKWLMRKWQCDPIFSSKTWRIYHEKHLHPCWDKEWNRWLSCHSWFSPSPLASSFEFFFQTCPSIFSYLYCWSNDRCTEREIVLIFLI